jgi:ectoine hydroxylase-related dioxygenase (phytanoyl-CoA dioxygenase family)
MLTEEQIKQFNQDGFILLPGLFDEAELTVLRDALPEVFSEEGPHRILEAGTGVVRGVHGVHETHHLFRTLVRLPRLVGAARQLLKDEVYVHQFKINAKMALIGEVWEWHQDFRFWRDEDGMPSARALTAAIFMDPVDEFNGPLMLVPGSHKDGVLDATSLPGSEWNDSFTAKLKYTITPESLAAVVADRGIVAPKGAAGSVLLFHSNILHGSAQNMSPVHRRIVLVSYNSVRNRLRDVPNPRPDFVASRNFEPIASVDDNALSYVLSHT